MYSKILIATDGSDTAARAVARGVDVARAMEATVVLVYVGDEAKGKPVLDAAAADLDVPVETVVTPGDPDDKIMEVAESVGADLIVIGNKGMTGAKRFLLGSVPNQISHHATCNVLIVKTT